MASRGSKRKLVITTDNKRDVNFLAITEKFVYEVFIFRHLPNRVELYDSKFIQSGVYKDYPTKYIRQDGHKLSISTDLIAAPLAWLKKQPNYKG